jgi:putative ABC transport system permease protein
MRSGPGAPVRWHTWLVRTVGSLVPRGLRRDWVQEWEAELDSREAELREWGMRPRRVSWRVFRDSTGALWDALWLQTHRWEDEMIQDIRFGLRLVRRSPWLSSTAIASLAIGIGATTAVFTVINAALLKALPYPAIERLVAVTQGESRYFSLAEYRDLQARATTIQHLSAIQTRDFVVSADGQPEQLRGQRVSASFPTLAGLDSTLAPVVGRSFAAPDFEAGHPAVALISHRLWVRRFASDPAIVGKAIALDATSATVIGVLPAGFDLFPNSDVLEPLLFTPSPQRDLLYRYLEVLGRLPAEDAIARVQTELTALGSRPDEPNQIRLAFVRELLASNVRRALLTMWAMTVLVLMVACLNFANLLTARGTARQQELAVRASLGGRRLRLIRQLIIEALVLVAIGGGFGLLLAHFGAGLLVAAMSQHFLGSEGVSIDARVIVFALTVSSSCGVIFAALPALHVSGSAQRAGSLLSVGPLRADRFTARRIHTVLASLQIALTLALHVGAALFVKSFWHLARLEPGYHAKDAVTLQFNLPESTYRDSASVIRFIDALGQRLRALPGVPAVAAASNLPLGPVGFEVRAFTVENGPTDVGPPEVEPPGLAPPPPPPPAPGGRPVTPYFQAVHVTVGPGFFGTMRIPVLAGRDFTIDDREKTQPVTIVNRAFADRYFPGADPIGRRIRMSPVTPWMTVVGVVGNIRRFARDDAHRSEFYRPFPQTRAVRISDGPEGDAPTVTAIMLVARTPRGPDDVARSVRGILATMDPALPIAQVSTLQGAIDDAVAQQRLLLRLFLAFAAATLVLAAVGVFGVTTYIVSRRQHELAVRVALGARPSSIEALVVRQGLPVIVIGLVLGLTTSIVLSRYVGEYLFRVSPLDGWAYVAVAAIMAIVVVTACYRLRDAPGAVIRWSR